MSDSSYQSAQADEKEGSNSFPDGGGDPPALTLRRTGVSPGNRSRVATTERRAFTEEFSTWSDSNDNLG
jgi:hypothetical protein